MKLVTRDELVKLPVGTIFQEWTPHMLVDSLQRIDGVCGEDDVFVSVVGPRVVMADYCPKLRPFDHISIDCHSGREANYSPPADCRYLILDQTDITAVIAQLLGHDVSDAHYVKATP